MLTTFYETHTTSEKNINSKIIFRSFVCLACCYTSDLWIFIS